MQQFELDFEGGLTERFPELIDCIRASVSGCGRQHRAVAADLDMSPSELTRKLACNPTDPVNFPAHRLPELIVATRDLTPIYWLVEKFCDDPDNKKRKSLEQLARLLPQIERLVKDAG